MLNAYKIVPIIVANYDQTFHFLQEILFFNFQIKNDVYKISFINL